MDGVSLEHFSQLLKEAIPPLIIDVRADIAYAASEGAIHGAIRRDPDAVAS